MVSYKLGEEIWKIKYSMCHVHGTKKRNWVNDGVGKVIGSIPVGDSDFFFFFPRWWHTEYFIFRAQKSLHWYGIMLC